jgi:hypothetical protein
VSAETATIVLTGLAVLVLLLLAAVTVRLAVEAVLARREVRRIRRQEQTVAEALAVEAWHAHTISGRTVSR